MVASETLGYAVLKIRPFTTHWRGAAVEPSADRAVILLTEKAYPMTISYGLPSEVTSLKQIILRDSAVTHVIPIILASDGSEICNREHPGLDRGVKMPIEAVTELQRYSHRG